MSIAFLVGLGDMGDVARPEHSSFAIQRGCGRTQVSFVHLISMPAPNVPQVPNVPAGRPCAE